MVIIVSGVAGDSLDGVGGVTHGESVFHQLQHFGVVAAVADGHALLGRKVPAFEQAADAVGFMQAGDNQIDKAKAAGDRLHDPVERHVQFIDQLWDLAVRQVEGEFEQRVVDAMVIAYPLQTVVVL